MMQKNSNLDKLSQANIFNKKIKLIIPKRKDRRVIIVVIKTVFIMDRNKMKELINLATNKSQIKNFRDNSNYKGKRKFKI